jgi:broad specificity phosphatase PhoE
LTIDSNVFCILNSVLKRAVHTLESLGKVALSSSPLHGQSILAVSHSTYIRVLLSLAENVSLVESFSSSWKIDNGSVSIIDINTDGKQRVVSAESGIFDTRLKVLGSANNDLVLVMPECHLIRRNEVRHLAGMSKVGNNIIH